jgi:nondiscriminating glutamyl-tRNA synthetase
MRSNGVATYNFCNVIDDHLHKISHVIRGEDHVNNTLRQVIVYEALGFDKPEFVHVSLLIGEDRQKLSKRHGSTSVKQYREEGYLPEALANYLCLLGWSHPDEKDIFSLDELKDVFSLTRFSKSHAIYDIVKLQFINSQHIKHMDEETLLKRASEFIEKDSPFFTHDQAWQKSFLGLYQDKINLFPELNQKISEITATEITMTDELKDILSWETTPQIKSYITEQLASLADEDTIAAETFKEWMNFCKKELKIKGKPLFMGFRGILTGQNHGPDLGVLIPLTPVKILKARIAAL